MGREIRGDYGVRAAIQEAVQIVEARIRNDGESVASDRLKQLFAAVAARFLESDFNTEKARAAGGYSAVGSDFMAAFVDTTGVKLGQYIAAARLDVAELLIRTTNLELGTISELVCYTYYPTFSKAFKRLKAIAPSDVPRQPPTDTPHDDRTSYRFGHGLLDTHTALHCLTEALRLYPEAARGWRSEIAVTGTIIVDGQNDDLLRARAIWQQIRDQPYSDQRRQVRRYLFRSTILFDFLREESRQEGRSNRQRGVEIARLALVSIEHCDDIFGDRIHDLRAHGLAWLGNAYRLALDFPAAAESFAKAAHEWNVPRASKDMTVLGNICFLNGSLLMMRRQYEEAADEISRSISLHRQAGEPRRVVRSLIQLAAINGYAGNLEEAQAHLRDAERLNAGAGDNTLTFAIHAAQANAMVRGGNLEEAATELEVARKYRPDDRLELLKLDFIAAYIVELNGRLDEAATQYESLCRSFKIANERRCYAIVGVDLMSVYSRQERWEKVTILAGRVLPILKGQQLHDETIASVRLVEDAIQKQALSQQTVTGLRTALMQDPLAA